MNTSLWPKLKPHAIAIGIFFIVSCLYCLPSLKGLAVDQYDTQAWRGMAEQSIQFKEQHGYYPLWANSMFSGMPAYQIALESRNGITIAYLDYLFKLFLPDPAGLFFLACIGFYMLTVVLRLRNWVGIFGSLAYGFASYNAVIVSVGHTTKFSSMGYAPAVLAGIILLSQRKYILGFISTLIFTTLLFYQNHVQIVYYTFLMAICLGIAYAIQAVREKQIAHLAKTAGLAVLAGLIGLASYAVMLWPTYDYAKETMRGGRSELTQPGNTENKSKGGLDKDYAFGWSYGITESLTAIVPRIFGGSSLRVVNNEYVSEFPDGSHTAKFLSERTGMPEEQADSFVKSLRPYWGDQPSTSGPVYFGAIVCVLFVLGLFYYKGPHKGWLIAATILGFVLAWGKNFSTVNYFLFDYLPFYNKFRAPSMALVIPQLTIALLASLGINEFFYGKNDPAVSSKRFRQFLYTVGAIAGILIVLYFTLEYKSPADSGMKQQLSGSMLQQMSQGKQPSPDMQQQAAEFGNSVVSSLRSDRRSLYGGDLIRSLIFMALGAGIVWLFLKNKIKAGAAVIAISAICLVDLLGVDLRYLNSDNYVEKSSFLDVYAPNQADLQINQDKGYYRVFDQADPSPFESARCAFHHNAVGGYHPAKLALYDDIIKNQLAKGNMQVYNMLNTKYFIVTNPADNKPMAQQNPGALGPCWLVRSIKYVNNADEEMKALDNFHPRDTVIVDKREKSKIPFEPSYDSSARITFLKNDNDSIKYEFDAASNQFAVFSEVYYPEGWNAYIDGKKAPIARVNYVLRGLAIPAGKHSIEMRFEPRSYFMGEKISLIIGILSYLLLIIAIFWEWRQYRKGSVQASKASIS